VEVAVRRVGASHLATLARWSLERSTLLTPVFLDEDRRSVRTLLRGAAAMSPEAERITGLIATPALPERALKELAKQNSVSGVAALLSAWEHPLGAGLLDIARDPTPDLLRLDVQLNANYITQAAAAVRWAPRGHLTRRELMDFVRDTADLENALAAMLLAGQATSLSPETLFLPEGRRLDRAAFLAAAQAPDSASAREMIHRAFRGSPLAEAFTGTRSAEDNALMARLRHSLHTARLFPLGAAPVMAFVLRVRAEIRDLCLIIWRIGAGAPPAAPRDLVSVV